ncbi:MAG TPA: Rieske (2Fe-2S) protein [Silvibacterium sp.]|nr:Rieske (2Fe-2S) protein [Silvibacterium sp.]
MAEFERLMSVSELPPEGEAREVACGAKLLCIANAGGAISAMDNVCPHRGGPLGQGIVEDGKIICPWHAWAFDAKTGIATHTPDAKVDVYEIKIADEDVLVKL